MWYIYADQLNLCMLRMFAKSQQFTMWKHICGPTGTADLKKE